MSPAVGYGRYGSLSLGGYMFQITALSNYAKVVVYRGGLRYEKNGFDWNSESINDVGLTLGLGCHSGSLSNVNRFRIR
jgi:hypothetical protein